ncbi:MAG: hypothetical protein E7587_01275 [Ruminococcaceae bacterium]|nr:hypothetical protein [Oscillospiraceae bacterium]
MLNARTSFSGEEDKRAYVAECEKKFEHALDCAVEKIISAESNRIITLSGPSCSGKTTTANKIVSEFEERGKRVHVISIDDFYYDRDYLIKQAEKNGTNLDFDSAETIDLDELEMTIESIFCEDSVKIPVFDFKSGKRIKEKEFILDDKDIFVFEGIQAVYPEVTRLFKAHPYFSVFAYVCEDLKVGDHIYEKNTVRFFRRLVRDYNFRNATPEFTFKLWESVRQNEERNILPFADDCDVLLNSLMPYEINMLKPYLVPLLSEIAESSVHFAYASEMLEKLEALEVISREYIPSNSVYREFLG